MKQMVFCCALIIGTPAAAETYSVSLGGKTLGQLSYVGAGKKVTLSSTLDNTPLGVFNGTFVGTSTGSVTSSTFTGDSKSSRKQRVVEVKIAKGRAIETTITPVDELTELSDITLVPAGIMDPVRAMGQLFHAKGCPEAVQMYDGRRVVTMRSDAGTQTGDTLICAVSYKVTAGPGHLSPLGISSAKMALIYGVSKGQQVLQNLKISSGIFSVSLDRQ